MKLHLFKVMTMAIMLSVSGVLVSAMSANSGALSIRVEVPFEFQIGDDTYPAGEYKFKQLERLVLAVEGIGNDVDGYVLGGTTSDVSGADYNDIRLTFHSYGDKNFLRAVGSSSTIFELAKSSAESKASEHESLTQRVVKY